MYNSEQSTQLEPISIEAWTAGVDIVWNGNFYYYGRSIIATNLRRV